MAYPTVAQVAARLRVGDDDPALAWITAAAAAYIDALPTRNLPEAVRDEAFLRYCGYLLDAPEAAASSGYSLPFRNSGALSLIGPWVEQRAGVIGSADGGSASTPSGGPGVDQVARDAAAAALSAARGAQKVAEDNMRKLMPPTPTEAAAAKATSIRGWTAALIRTLVEAVVPAWARATNAPVSPIAAHIGFNPIAFIAGDEDPFDLDVSIQAPANRFAPADRVELKIHGLVIDTQVFNPAKTEQVLTYGIIGTILESLQNNRHLAAGEFLEADLVFSNFASEQVVYTATRFIPVVSAAAAGGLDRGAVEALIGNDVVSWALAGSSANIPGDRTFPQLFESAQQSDIGGGDTGISFDVGDAGNNDLVDETDAQSGNGWRATAQAAPKGSFVRVRYALTVTGGGGAAPSDLELILREHTGGKIVGRHNIAGPGDGEAQFDISGVNAPLVWALRTVTRGRTVGVLDTDDTRYHSGEARADRPIRHVMAPTVSDLIQARQALDTRVAKLEAGGDGALTKTTVWDETSNTGAVNDHALTDAEATAIKTTAKRFTIAIRFSKAHEFWAMGDLDLALFRGMYGGTFPNNFNLFTRVLTGADASVGDEMTCRIRNNSGSWELRIQGGSGKRFRVIAALWE